MWQTETYYETEHYTEHCTDSHGHPTSHPACRQVARTHQLQVTCSTCTGCGRTLHHQILNTQWRHLIPKVTYPEIPIPELVDNAEEVKFFRLPLTVDFNSGLFPPETLGIHNKIVNRMNQTGQYLASIKRIAEFPGLGKPLKGLPEGSIAYYAGRHVIVYQVRETHLEIIRILYDGMDIKRHFPDES